MNEVMDPREFQNRLVDRLRNDVMNLIPDEKLAELAEQAMQSMFFTRRERKRGGYSDTVEVLPSWWEEEVEKVLRERVHLFATDYLNANREKLEKVIAESIAENLPLWLATALTNIFTSSTQSIGYNLGNDITQKLRAAGIV